MIAYGPVKIQKNNHHKNNYDNNYDNNDKSLSGKESEFNKNSLIIFSNVKNEKTVNEKIPSSSTDKKLKISILKFITKMCEKIERAHVWTPVTHNTLSLHDALPI